MRRALVLAAVLVVLVWLALHPAPGICYGVFLHGTYHYAPIPCGMWPLD